MRVYRRLSVYLAILVSAVSVLLATLSTTPASAQAPWWQLASSSQPRNLPPGGEGEIVVTATNLGDAEVNGASTPVTITDTLPPGVTANAIKGVASSAPTRPTALECTQPAGPCQFAGKLSSYERLEAIVHVTVNAQPEEENKVVVSGGGAPSISVNRPIAVDGAPTPFGVEEFQLTPEDEGGAPDIQAVSYTHLRAHETGRN